MTTCPKIRAVIEALAAQHGVTLTQAGSRLRLDLPGFDHLCIECLTPWCIRVAHYAEVSDGLLPEPEIVFFTANAAGWIPLEITQSLTGWLQLAPRGFTGPLRTGSRTPMFAEVIEFAETWADNLVAQGWSEKGERHVYAELSTGADVES